MLLGYQPDRSLLRSNLESCMTVSAKVCPIVGNLKVGSLAPILLQDSKDWECSL